MTSPLRYHILKLVHYFRGQVLHKIWRRVAATLASANHSCATRPPGALAPRAAHWAARAAPVWFRARGLGSFR